MMADDATTEDEFAVQPVDAESFEQNVLQRLYSGRELLREYMAGQRFYMDAVEESMSKYAHRDCLVFGDNVYTYADIDRRSNQFANFVLRRGLKFGDTVAVLMYNEPAFFWTVFGLAKVGIKGALLNVNLRNESLVHCLDISNAKVIIVGEVFSDQLLQALHQISETLQEKGISVWYLGSIQSPVSPIIQNIQSELRETEDKIIPRECRRRLNKDDALLYLFTSGTTGLPKAVRLLQSRMLSILLRGRIAEYVKTDDRVYMSLPLFHGTGFMVGTSYSVSNGATMILAPKFSVSKFWDDIIKYQATVFIHIGEICRYLLSRPKSPTDNLHKVRLIIGNGLTKDIWREFQTRFRIGTIYEFYGATDGTFSSMNIDNTAGAVGRFTPRLKEVIEFELVQCDVETAEPIRNSYGRCIPVKLGEAGLLIHRISDGIPFGGYKGDPKISERKILRNVFVDGDAYVNSGDLLRLDHNYYIYFVDRLGDTFRWKGENVATTEVTQTIGSFPGISDVRVYGVKVPGHDGRAGMAAVVLKQPKLFDFARLYSHITSQLPKYACPLFLRVGESFDMTATYKVINTKLKKEGFDPNVVDDQLFYMDTKQKTYLPLTGDEFKKIVMGKSRL
ncbi:long-chain fatty acid transport protein 2-like [Glandiceps talaboti]